MIEKDFLKNFEQRMKCVGRYSVLCSNSFDKKLWKDYGVENRDEQMNMLFTLLLFIMEYSLREENCTMNEIAAFVEDVSYEYYARRLSFEEKSGFSLPKLSFKLAANQKEAYFSQFKLQLQQTLISLNTAHVD